MSSHLPFNVADPMVEIFTDGENTGLSLSVHQGLLATSCEYLNNVLAAAGQVAAEMQVFTRQNTMIVVDVPHNVMVLFARWLYTPRKDTFKHDFTNPVDLLLVWKYTQQHLRNSEFRDGLVDEMVKLISTLTDVRGPDHAATEVTRALNTLKCDIEGGMARFIVEWYLSCNFKEASVCDAFSAVLTVSGPHPGLCQAFIQAKMHDKTVPGEQQLPSQPVTLCRYHEHPAHQKCNVSITWMAQKPQSKREYNPKSTPVNKKEDDAEVLQYMQSANEDYTKLHGVKRKTMRRLLRDRMLRAKRLQDSTGSVVSNTQPANLDGDSDMESITVAATPRSGVSTRSTRASLRNR